MQFIKHGKSFTYYYFDVTNTRTIIVLRKNCSGVRAIIKADIYGDRHNLEVYNIKFPNGEYYILDEIKRDLLNYCF